MQEIEYINKKMNGEKTPLPRYLYKYRLFDDFTYDMLENNYLFLCPANKLDDPTECITSLSIRDIYDFETNQLKFLCVYQLLELVRPYTTEENFNQIKRYVEQILTINGLIRRDVLLDSVFDLQALVPDKDIAPLINFLGNIPERLNDPIINKNITKLFSLANNARQELGICSLTALGNSKEMWDKYSSNSTGYCIKYDMTDYENLYALYPVVYQDDRKTNIASNIIASFIGEMIFGMSVGRIRADRSQYIRMFLTKDKKWSYQKEWRLMGDAQQKIKAPTIRAIHIGKNTTLKNKEKITSYCDKHSIKLRYL